MMIWMMAAFCGCLSDQLWSNSSLTDNNCQILRNYSSNVELLSLLLTFPLPLILTLALLVFRVCQTSFQFSQSCRIQITLCVVYLLTIFPSLVVDNLAQSLNTTLLVIIKFSLASFHIILEPGILLLYRSDLSENVKNIFKGWRL